MDFFNEYSPAELKSVKALLVGDDLLALEQTSWVLKRVVGEVFVADNPSQGLALFVEKGADFVVTDLLMPGMGGLELAEGIRELDSDVPIIVLMATEEPACLLSTAECSIDRILLKPLLPDSLLAAVSRSMRMILMRRRLKEAEDAVRTVLDHSPHFALMEERGKVTYVNRQMLWFLGFDSYGAFCRAGKSLGEYMHRSDGLGFDDPDNWLSEILSDPLDRERHVEMVSQRWDGALSSVFVVGQHEFGTPECHMVTLTDVTELEGERRKLERQANHDPLTGCVNRRRFLQLLHEEEALAQSDEYTFSLVMLDIDHFKGVNDSFGHDVGDAVLKGVAEFALSNKRDTDVFARLGGEEFVMLMPNGTLHSASLLAERLRQIIASTQFRGVDRAVTVSFGVAEARKGEVGEALLKRADQALYAAKSGGRNCVVQS